MLLILGVAEHEVLSLETEDDPTKKTGRLAQRAEQAEQAQREREAEEGRGMNTATCVQLLQAENQLSQHDFDSRMCILKECISGKAVEFQQLKDMYQILQDDSLKEQLVTAHSEHQALVKEMTTLKDSMKQRDVTFVSQPKALSTPPVKSINTKEKQTAAPAQKPKPQKPPPSASTKSNTSTVSSAISFVSPEGDKQDFCCDDCLMPHLIRSAPAYDDCLNHHRCKQCQAWAMHFMCYIDISSTLNMPDKFNEDTKVCYICLETALMFKPNQSSNKKYKKTK